MTPGLARRPSTDTIVVHCSASPPNPKTTWRDIDRWHRQRGFLMIGYHYVIRTDGEVETTPRHIDSIGAHAAGHNTRSVGICMVGGVDKDMQPADNFAPVQKASLSCLLAELLQAYPGANIVGHRDLPGVKKACPSFDVRAWLPTAGFSL